MTYLEKKERKKLTKKELKRRSKLTPEELLQEDQEEERVNDLLDEQLKKYIYIHGINDLVEEDQYFIKLRYKNQLAKISDNLRASIDREKNKNLYGKRLTF